MSDTQTAEKPKSAVPRKRWAAKAALAFLLLIVAAFGGLVLARTQVAERFIAYALRANGIDDARFRVTALGPASIAIEPFDVGRELKTKRIAAQWSWPGILNRKIDTVEIDGIALDASDPDGGIFKIVRDRAGGPGGGVALPRIVVRNGSATGARSPLSFAAAFDATMEPDGSATVRFRDMQVRAAVGNHAPGLENGQGRIVVAAGAKSATATLEEGRLTDAAKVPWFKPLATGGTATYADGRATFGAEATTAAGAAVVVSGEHDMGSGEGGAKLSIPGFRFDDAMRPSDIAPGLGDGLSAKGGVSADIRARWSGSEVTADGSLDLDDVSLDAGTFKIEGLTAQAKLSGRDRTATAAVDSLRARVRVGDMGVAVADARVEATYDRRENRTAFKIAKAALEDIGARTIFRSSNLTGEGTVRGSVLTAKGTLTLAAHPSVGARFDGAFDLAKNEGRAKVATDGLVFKGEGLKPADLSPLLDAVANASGTVVADGDLTWRAGRLGGGLRADLDGVSFDAHGARIRDAVVALRVDNIDPPTAAVQVARAGIAYAGHAVRIESAEARVTPQQDGFALVLEDSLVVDAAKTPRLTPIRLSGNGTKAADTVRFDVKAAGPGTSSLTAKGEHAIGTDSGWAELVLPAVTFAAGGLQPKEVAPALAELKDVSGEVTGRAKLAWSKGVFGGTGALTARRVSLTSGDVALSGMDVDVTLDSISPTKVRLAIPEAWIAAGGERLRVGDLTADAIHDPNSMVPPFLMRLKDATVSDGHVPARAQTVRVVGSATVEKDTVYFEGKATGTVGGRVAVRGEHSLGGSGSADLRLEKIVFGPVLQPSALAAALKIVEPASGGVSGAGSVRWDASGIDGSAAVTLDGLSLAHETTTVEGIDGTLRLDSLRPLSGPMQTISAKRIGAAQVLSDPTVRFAVEPAGSLARLRVEKAEAGLFDGRVSAENFVVDPTAEKHRIALRLDRVDLERLFRFIEIKGLSGTGRIAGTVPVVVDGGKAAIENAKLASVTDGVLRFRNMPARGVLAAGGDHLELVSRVLDDLRYDKLSLAADKAAGGEAKIDLAVRGFNPLVLEGHPFAINLSLNGNVDKFLAQVLRAHDLSNKAIRATVEGVR